MCALAPPAIKTLCLYSHGEGEGGGRVCVCVRVGVTGRDAERTAVKGVA